MFIFFADKTAFSQPGVIRPKSTFLEGTKRCKCISLEFILLLKEKIYLLIFRQIVCNMTHVDECVVQAQIVRDLGMTVGKVGTELQGHFIKVRDHHAIRVRPKRRFQDHPYQAIHNVPALDDIQAVEFPCTFFALHGVEKRDVLHLQHLFPLTVESSPSLFCSHKSRHCGDTSSWLLVGSGFISQEFEHRKHPFPAPRWVQEARQFSGAGRLTFAAQQGTLLLSCRKSPIARPTPPRMSRATSTALRTSCGNSFRCRTR